MKSTENAYEEANRLVNKASSDVSKMESWAYGKPPTEGLADIYRENAKYHARTAAELLSSCQSTAGRGEVMVEGHACMFPIEQHSQVAAAQEELAQQADASHRALLEDR